jgi:hypothetical protein
MSAENALKKSAIQRENIRAERVRRHRVKLAADFLDAMQFAR